MKSYFTALSSQLHFYTLFLIKTHTNRICGGETEEATQIHEKCSYVGKK